MKNLALGGKRRSESPFVVLISRNNLEAFLVLNFWLPQLPLKRLHP